MTVSLDPKTTALLVMDFQNGIVARFAEPAPLLDRTKAVLEAARKAGAFVGFVVVAFREGHPEVSAANLSFSQIRSTMMLIGSPETTAHEAVAPRSTEPIVVKHRVGAFLGTDLDQILRSRRVETIVLLGISTSGVVLSTLRYAADADYRIVVAEDGCADLDEETHRVLMTKVFPRQATVTSCDAIKAAFAG